jgi:hypothetical protein
MWSPTPDRLTRSLAATVAIALLTVSAPTSAQRPNSHAEDWSAVDRTLGRAGANQPGGVRKYSFPRTDLRVTVDGVVLRPALALGSWVALHDMGGGKAMAMGDLVLLESEVQPVIHALQQGGVQQTALHNHLMRETPHVMYMHVAGTGDAAALARTIREALGTTATPLAAPAPASSGTAPALALDTAAIARALGARGAVNGGVYQVSVPRRETVREHGTEVLPSMGVATAINFQPTTGGRAVTTGDFVMRASEVNAVIRALDRGGIAVTALHSHMLDEEPRLFFMHFWGNGDAAALARTLGEALGQMAVQRARR